MASIVAFFQKIPVIEADSNSRVAPITLLDEYTLISICRNIGLTTPYYKVCSIFKRIYEKECITQANIICRTMQTMHIPHEPSVSTWTEAANILQKTHAVFEKIRKLTFKVSLASIVSKQATANATAFTTLCQELNKTIKMFEPVVEIRPEDTMNDIFVKIDNWVGNPMYP
jgi:hypothetical protein